MEGFLMTIEQALEFYKRCEQTNATTYDEKRAILMKMQKERRVFLQTEDQIKARLKGKKVLMVEHKDGKYNEQSS